MGSPILSQRDSRTVAGMFHGIGDCFLRYAIQRQPNTGWQGTRLPEAYQIDIEARGPRPGNQVIKRTLVRYGRENGLVSVRFEHPQDPLRLIHSGSPSIRNGLEGPTCRVRVSHDVGPTISLGNHDSE